MLKVPSRICAAVLFVLFVTVVGAGTAAAESPVEPVLGSWAHLPEDADQLILVLSNDWKTTTATLWTFHRTSATHPWKRELGPFPVNLGRTGLAWGRSPLMRHPLPDGPTKKEGDGKAPAGLFEVVSAFGHPNPPSGYGEENLPFVSLTDQHCVDDPNHALYNRIVSPREVEASDWKSSETMAIPLYRLGLVVDHNCSEVEPGAGSCIFFHLQRGPGSPTAGCTSMAPSDLTALVLWLKRDARPVLLQLPEAEHR